MYILSAKQLCVMYTWRRSGRVVEDGGLLGENQPPAFAIPLLLRFLSAIRVA